MNQRKLTIKYHKENLKSLEILKKYKKLKGIKDMIKWNKKELNRLETNKI